MKKIIKLYLILYIFALLPLFINPPVLSASENANAAVSGIPMSAGNYWIYKGNVKYLKEGTQKEFSRPITFKMEITDVIKRENITAALLKGYPLDLSRFTGLPAERGDYLLVLAGSGSYYLLSGENAVNAMKKINDENDSLYELVDESDMIADFPLAAGKVFGEAEQVTRTDGKYCWRVEECVDSDFSSVKGAGIKNAREYWLFYLTNPDRQKAGFVPGVGITSYSYRHNGTTMEFDVKLTECNIAAAPAAAEGGNDKKNGRIKKDAVKKSIKSGSDSGKN